MSLATIYKDYYLQNYPKMSVKELAKHFSVNVQAVYKHFKKFGIKLHRQYKEKYTCQNCSKTGTDYAYRERQFCSKKCANQYHLRSPEVRKKLNKGLLKKVICLTCKKEFEYYRSARPNPKYCSNKCTQTRAMVDCVICGKEMEKRPGEIKKNKTGFTCGGECFREHLSNLHKWDKNVNFKGGSIDVECWICGDSITKDISNYNQSKTKRFICDKKECKAEHHRRLAFENDFGSIHGKDHPNWKGGVSYRGYSMKWNNKLKGKVRDRDDRVCQMCGKTQKENGRNLDVHHINYDKHDLEEFNLISLCRPCHARTRTNQEYWWQELYDIQAFNYLGATA